ncbi:MAG: hypothetical protein H6720_12545 [Sandaracinus sp.]|nr:hypothetical protein [Sandaracinus sp.]
MDTAVEHALRPLDALRWRALVSLGGVGRRLVRERALRVAAWGLLAVALAFVGATAFPIVLLALGPIVWGVPHVVADVRYLVVRRGLHRRAAVGGVTALGLVASAWTGHVTWATATAATVALLSRASHGRRLVVAFVFLALTVVGSRDRTTASLVFAHLHNLVALVLWWFWRPRRGVSYLVLLLYAAAALVLALGLVEPLGTAWRLGGFGLHEARESLAPGVTAPWGTRLVVLFAFAQAMHYALWVRLVPEEDRERPTPRTFRASWRALRTDLGGALLSVAALSAIGVAAWALVDLADAREGYLRAAIFHGHLELVALALLATEGRSFATALVRPRRSYYDDASAAWKRSRARSV